MVEQGLVHRAHARAQRRFHAMLEAHALTDPQARETRLYNQAEGLVNALIGEAQWESSKATFDRLMLADIEAGEVSINDPIPVAPGQNAMWVEAELREAFGR